MSSYRGVNLARRPFVNSRPVVRVAIGLWTIGFLLLAANLYLYWASLHGFEEKRQRLDELEAANRSENERIVDLRRQLRSLEIDDQNEEVEYLNSRIEARAFAWSRLFDRLASVLPVDVRLFSLSPMLARVEVHGTSPGRQRRVILTVQGSARNDQALLDLLDALYRDPAFEDPDLAGESRQDLEIRFRLSVAYLPSVVGEPTLATADEASDPKTGGGDPGIAAAEGSSGGTGEAIPPGADMREVVPGGAREAEVPPPSLARDVLPRPPAGAVGGAPSGAMASRPPTAGETGAPRPRTSGGEPGGPTVTGGGLPASAGGGGSRAGGRPVGGSDAPPVEPTVPIDTGDDNGLQPLGDPASSSRRVR